MKSTEKNHGLRDRLWFRVFRNVALIFLAFVLVLAVANSTLLVRFYIHRQKNLLLENLTAVAEIDWSQEALSAASGDSDSETASAAPPALTEIEGSDRSADSATPPTPPEGTQTETADTALSAAATNTLAEISDKNHFEIEIYRENGQIIYTTSGSQMMDFVEQGRSDFSMQHEKTEVLQTETYADGTVFETAVGKIGGDHEYLLCYREIADGVFAEVRVQKALITEAAATANRFMLIVAGICLAVSLGWILIFARRFSRPITRMNEITQQLSRLDFSRKVQVDTADEIGQLADSVNEMSDSLSVALTELKAANAKLTDEIEAERRLDVMRRAFVADVSHELKTPIAIISGYAEGLKLNVNDASREEYCDTILDESRRMNRLVLRILELSKYESGQIPIQPEVFDLSAAADALARRIFKDCDITLRQTIAENTRVFADAGQIEQVLKAYLENARAHTPAGGTVTVSVEPHGSCLRVSVHNTGSHVPQEQMPQIWQSFFRGDSSHKRESSRFGLGLSIVSAIMKMHGTACGVYNTPDGVCFWFDVTAAD